MQALFDSVNQMMSGGLFFVLVASFIWGLMSIALSPCHLTSIPLIIGFVDESEAKRTKQRFILSLLFALGILISIAAIGVITASFGRVAGDIGPWSNYLAAVIFAIIGLHFFDIIPLNFRGVSSIPIQKKGKWSAFLIGLIFGVALGPCTFAFMAPVLAVTFAKSGSSIIENSLILIAYGVGHTILIVMAGTFTGVLQKYLSWNSENGSSDRVKKIAGVFLLIGALYFLSK